MMRHLIPLIALTVAACGGGPGADPFACPTGEVYASPPCGGDGILPEVEAAGCVPSCAGAADDSCATGTCTEVWSDPCLCVEGENCCGACSGTTWLCQ